MEFKGQIEVLQLQLQTFIDNWNRNSYTVLNFVDN